MLLDGRKCGFQRLARSRLATLYEDAMNKPRYMDGGYYAARFSALEFLEQRRRQAAIYVNA